MFDDEPTPPKNVPLIKLYERLCALLSSLPPNIGKSSLRDGSGQRFNGYIDELSTLTSDPSLNDFKVEVYHLNNRAHVSGEAYARQLNALTNYLYKTDEVIGYYCGYPPASNFSKAGTAGTTTVNNHLKADQQVSQSTNIQIEFTQTIISLTEALTNFEHEHPDESSKENKFAKALKKALPITKDTLDIVSSVLKIAGQVGLDPQTALKALGLS